MVIFNECIMIKKFRTYLLGQDLTENTVRSYLWTVGYFLKKYEEISYENLLAYKGFLVEHFKPQTVNLRLQAINKYLEFTKQEEQKLHFVKVQQKNFLENVISDADYKFFKKKMKADGHESWYFVVWFLTATGARISELLQIKAEHVQAGYLDIYSKGGKMRRLYIPKILKAEASEWLFRRGITSGYIFLNRFGKRITARGIAQQLKLLAKEYGINTEVVYPHSFRHRFAKNFLERFNDLALLADLMGHESIETTRIYLRRTTTEQQAIVDKVVNW
jgi:site-specific recombinase XerD